MLAAQDRRDRPELVSAERIQWVCHAITQSHPLTPAQRFTNLVSASARGDRETFPRLPAVRVGVIFDARSAVENSDRAVDAGESVEVRPVVSVDVRVADEELADDDRRPDHLHEVLGRVREVEQGEELVALDQREDRQRETADR